MSEIAPDLQAIVAVEQTRGKIESVIEQQKNKLLRNACALVKSMTPDNQEAFLSRTVTALLDEKLKDCFASPEGKLSIFRIIEESLATGLELGKHAYAVPQPKKKGDIWIKTARYDVKRQGFHALLCGGDKPIFRDLKWGAVYEKDKCSIDGESGKVNHNIAIVKDRGALIGVWVQADIIMHDSSTRTEAEFYPIDYIHGIRDNHSESWKSYKAGKVSSTPWVTDEIPMAEKTAIKAFCRPYADVKDALAHAIYEESDSMPTPAEEVPREEVAERILDNVLTQEPGRGTIEAEESHQPEENIDDELAELSKDADKDGLF